MMMNKMKVVVLAVTAIVGLSGCATAIAPQPMSKFDKSGKGEVFAAVAHASRVSGQSVCEAARGANPEFNDKRCEAPDDYYGVSAVIYTNSWVADHFPILIPKDVDVSGGTIIKARLKEGFPAYYEGIFGKTIHQSPSDDRPCYWDRNIFGAGGIVCPKFGWDYRNHVPNL